MAVAAVALVTLTACGGSSASSASPEPDALRVVATTTVLADLVRNVGGSAVTVRSLVPPGGEVHTFDPSPADVAAVAEADLTVTNGAGLDEWATELVEGAGSSGAIVELAEDLDGVDYIESEGHDDHEGTESGEEHGVNPHLWLNVAYTRLYVSRIMGALSQAAPGDASTFRARAEDYDGRLAELDRSIADRIGIIPAADRKIVSFHEAFPYFAQAYGLEVVGVVVDAPGQDPSAGEIAALVEAIRTSGAKAVFSEAQFDDRLARTIAEEAGVTVESRLHNDSLGEPPADTYVGMMADNTDRIVSALQ